MPAEKLIVRPGVNALATPNLAEGSWVATQLVRFFQGFLQKYGGFQRLISTPVIGFARTMLSWEDGNANQYIAIGSAQAFQVYLSGLLYNVTPIMATDTVSVSFSTVSTTPTVKIADSGNPAVAGDYVIILNPISVGGLIIQGTYLIASVIDSNHYTITAATNATGTVNNGGAAALFTTTMSSPIVQVTLANHGLSFGQIYTVYVPTTVGGVALSGAYNVASVIDSNNFTITATDASSGTTGSENGGDVTLQYLLTSGNVSSSNQVGTYGGGDYGAGVYGIGTSSLFTLGRIWTFGYWGTDINASFTNGGFYTWISEDGLINNPAVIISTAPKNIGAGIFTAMPQQQAIALGASDGSSTDPDQMLVRFSDVADNTDWTASATNQAGSFRLSRGARIVGGIQGPQCGLIWTDVGFWLMQYIGFPLVYGFIEIGQGCGLIGQLARGVLAGKVYWMSYNGFFVYDGNSVQPLPCSVWDKVFKNINTLQAVKIIACPNSFFNEISWCFPSVASESGNGENDTRVTYNAIDGTWTYDPTGAIQRSAWLDQSSLLNPLGIDQNMLIQQHEFGNDADGAVMVTYAQTGFIKIAAGQEYTFLERLIPDAVLSSGATLQFTFTVQNYTAGPYAAPYTVGPLSFTAAVSYLITRVRGRFVSITVGSSDLGSFWRLGECIEIGAPAGRR